MNRQLSPILHDYKPSTDQQVKTFNALHWFVAGLGLPLLGIALMLSLRNNSESETPVVAAEVLPFAVQDEPLPIGIVDNSPAPPAGLRRSRR